MPFLEEAGYKVSLIWDKRIQFPFDVIKEVHRLKVDFISTPLDLDGPFVNTVGKTSDSNELVDALRAYEFVIADTVTWPLRVHSNAILIAQFTWEQYYHKKFPVGKGRWEEKSKLMSFDCRVYSMEIFRWEEMYAFPDLRSIPVLDYWGLRERGILRNERIGNIQSGTLRLSNENHPLGGLSTNNRIDLVKGLENYIAKKGSVPAGIICRAGVGAISECISAKSLPILLPDVDIEIQYNRNALLDLGLAIDLKELRDIGDEEILQIRQTASSLEWPDVLSAQDFTQQILEEK